MQSKSVVHHFRHEKSLPICSLAWNPAMVTKKEIVFCDSRGHLGLLENVTQSGPNGASPMDVVSSNATLQEDDDDAEFSITQIKKNTGFVVNEEDGQDVFTGVRPALMGKHSLF